MPAASTRRRTKRQPAGASCPVERYARAVVGGEVVAGRLVRLACERHLRDLDAGHERGLRWDAAAAERAFQFFGLLSLPCDGELDGKPFKLEPFQEFIVGSLFGWKGEDGYRRFRTAYVEQGKGNGKTPLAAGIGLYGLVADGEAGAEIYSGATTAFQAGILFRDAKRMVTASAALAPRLEVLEHNIAYPRTDSFFRPVSSEHRQLSGPRPHMALIDEVHEHPNALVVDKLRAGTKGRRQALVFEITNSGHDRTSVCWAHHEYSRKILEGSLANDSWFAYVCGLDPCADCRAKGKDMPDETCGKCDRWDDEATWPKANPNLGVSITLKYLREQVAEAKGMPTKEGIVKRLNFCLWTESETAWLPRELWALGAVPVRVRPGARCHGGLDMAAKLDLAAFALAFPDGAGGVDLLAWFWIPEATADAREKADKVPYRVWAREGRVKLTPGNVVDPNVIEKDIQGLAGQYQLESVRYDQWNATQMALNLQQYGLTMVEFAQSPANYNEPTREFERLLKAGKLRHGAHPVLDWCASNVTVLTDRRGLVRPVKPEAQSAKKVDGIQAAVMALAGLITTPDETSVYETRGIEFL